MLILVSIILFVLTIMFPATAQLTTKKVEIFEAANKLAVLAESETIKATL
jgi:hypothetical protein